MNGTNFSTGLLSTLAAAYLSTTTQPVLGINPGIVLAGLIGSVICVLLQKNLSGREMAAIGICGTAASIYGSKVVARWIGTTDESTNSLIGLLLGVGGIYIFRRLVDTLQDPQYALSLIRAGKFLDLLKPTPRPEPVSLVKLQEPTNPVPVVVADPHSPIPDKPQS